MLKCCVRKREVGEGAESQNCEMEPLGFDFERTVGSIELNILEQALRKTRGNKKLAAEMLGLKRTTLTAKLKSLAAGNAAG